MQFPYHYNLWKAQSVDAAFLLGTGSHYVAHTVLKLVIPCLSLPRAQTHLTVESWQLCAFDSKHTIMKISFSLHFCDT
jgi:hypothetical protein